MYNGNAIEVGRASQLTGLPLYRIIILIKAGRIFGTRIRDRWMVSPEVLPELRSLAKEKTGPCIGNGSTYHREGNSMNQNKRRPLAASGQRGGGAI